MFFPWFISLKENEQALLEGLTKRWVVNGPGVYCVPAFVKAYRRLGITLSPTEFVKVKNKVTGDLQVEKGPRFFFLTEQQEIASIQEQFVLKHNEYMKIIEKTSGVIRVEQGERNVVLNPNEEVLEPPTPGINIDEHTGVIIRNTKNGSLRLITENCVFFPGPDEEIEAVETKILLEPHETVILKDKDGNLRFMHGDDASNRAFFLQPFETLVTLKWSVGLHKDKKELHITRIDKRPKFMWYEFEVRTKDNVELILGITFFWQLADIAKMVNATDDAPGDVCAHARSMIIQSISKSTLENFLDRFNDIVKACVLEQGDCFYSERGVCIHSIEVRSIACKNESTQEILQEIIQETTNRLNKLQKQESENEIELNKVRGRIEAEKQKNELLMIQAENVKKESEITGQSEAIKIKVFFEILDHTLSNPEKISMYTILRKEEYIDKLSKGNAKMIFTPKDVDVSIETRDL